MSTNNDSTRLNKYLALHAGLSRRQADEEISSGKVTVNGQPAIIGARVRPGDTVTLDGKPLSATTELRYVMLHKPVGYVCSRRAQGDNPTIYSLLPKDLHALKPVGRLDKDSSGLILLTNDGDFALQMTHPSFYKVKRYVVTLNKPLKPLHHQMIVDHGVTLDDGISTFAVVRLEDAESYSNSHVPIANRYEVTMHEGRNRQIRRTFAALGYTVTKLHRTDFGPYSLGRLAPGRHQTIEK